MTTMKSPNFVTTTQPSALFLPNNSHKHSPQQQKCCSSRTGHEKQHQQLQLDDSTNGSLLSRRTAICGTVTGFLMQGQYCGVARGLELNLDFDKMMNSGPSAPTLEDAVSLIRGHAAALLEVKTLLEEESWSDAQRMLRKNSSNLKIDLSSIIQSKAPALRPRLRSLYSHLFNTVTKMDYAAREKDTAMVLELYEKMALDVKEILSII
ncbi:PsbQ-like protein 3, chloroplastic [Linum grandiflorum]